MANNSRARKERQAAALRENLKRRKVRARALDQSGKPAPTEPNAAPEEPDAKIPVPHPIPAAKNT